MPCVKAQASELRKGSHRLLPLFCEPPEVVAATLSLRALRGVRRLMGVVIICAELHGVPASASPTALITHRLCLHIAQGQPWNAAICSSRGCHTSTGRFSSPSHGTQLDLAGPHGKVERGQRLRCRAGIRRHTAHEQHLC